MALFVLTFFTLSVVLHAGVDWVLAAMDPRVARAWASAGRGLIARTVPSLIVAVCLYALLVWKTRWTARGVGVPPWRVAGAAFARGLGVGVALAAATLALAFIGGARLVTGPGFQDERYSAVAVAVLLGLAAAALLEELVFRGYPLARMARGFGPVPASVALTTVFVVLHAPNPEVTPLGLVNIGLAGLVLAGAFFVGGLPAAWGVHLGWNAGLALGADAPVSGLRFGLPVLEYVPGSTAWWDGGAFGPEGGLAATLVLGALAVLAMRRVQGAPLPGEGDPST